MLERLSLSCIAKNCTFSVNMYIHIFFFFTESLIHIFVRLPKKSSKEIEWRLNRNWRKKAFLPFCVSRALAVCAFLCGFRQQNVDFDRECSKHKKYIGHRSIYLWDFVSHFRFIFLPFSFAQFAFSAVFDASLCSRSFHLSAHLSVCVSGFLSFCIPISILTWALLF